MGVIYLVEIKVNRWPLLLLLPNIAGSGDRKCEDMEWHEGPHGAIKNKKIQTL